MSTETMAAYFCVGPPGYGPYYCVQPEPTPWTNPPMPWGGPTAPVHKPCGCPTFTPEPMPADLARKLVEVLERHTELLRENAELRRELDAIKRATDSSTQPQGKS